MLREVEEEEATGAQAVFSEAQRKAIAEVVGDVLKQVLKDTKKDDHREDTNASQPSGSQGRSAQGERGDTEGRRGGGQVAG